MCVPSMLRVLWCCVFSCGFCSREQQLVLLFGNHIVDAWSVGCGVSCWPSSTGQLHGSLGRASTSSLATQLAGWGPLTQIVYGNLNLKRASRLDGFSGYPIRT